MNENDILKEIETNFLDFEKLDKIFQKKLPQEIVKVIFDMIEPICNDCFNCCNICRIYCYLGCLRNESGRNVCNKPEFERSVLNYEKKEPIEDEEENEPLAI